MEPTIGRIVHYVQKKPPMYGTGVVHIPAIITAVWGNTCVNLQVFTDGTNSDPFNMNSIKWITSVSLDSSDTPSENTWHWPERE